MIEWTTVLSLLLFGIALVVVEIIFVPGTTVVGVVGFVFMVIGVGLSFRYFGSTVGWSTAAASAVLSGVVLIYSFKANVWGRFSLKSTIDSKVNEGELAHLATGQEGVTVSALRPSGKAELDKKLYEVRTNGTYIEPGTRVRILQILSNQIIVEPLL